MRITKHGYILATESNHTGAEPRWESANDLTLAEYKIAAAKAVAFYNYYCNPKDCQKFVHEWMKDQPQYSKIHLEIMSQGGHKFLTSSTGRLCRAFSMGMPHEVDGFDDYHKMVTNAIKDAIISAPPIKKDPTIITTVKKSPMVLLGEKLINTVLGPIEDQLDEWVEGGAIKAIDVYALLKGNAIPAAGATIVRKHLAMALKEFKEVQLGKDPQLVEGYSHLTTRQINGLVRVFTKMTEDAKKYEQDKKVNRKVRVKKPRPARKQVAAVKYLEKSDEYSFTSLSPLEIPGAQTVYLFNTKTRALSVLKAGNRDGMSVKGTTISGFDDDASFKLTLRKPQDILNQFKKKKGIKKIEKVIGGAKTKRRKVKGRINADTLIIYASTAEIK